MGPPKWMIPASLFPAGSLLPLTSPGDSPIPASRSDSGSFQTELGLGVCEILHMPFKSRVPTSVQSQMFGRLVCSFWGFWAEKPNMGPGPFILWGEALQFRYSFCYQLRGVGPDYTPSLPLPPIPFSFLPMSLVVENLLLVFWPFPQSCSVNTVDLAFLDFSFLSVIKGK